MFPPFVLQPQAPRVLRGARGNPPALFNLLPLLSKLKTPHHSPAQVHVCLRRISLMALSRPSRKRDRSRLPNGGGPPAISPSSRSSKSKFRVASAGPILSSVNGLPVGPSTVAP